MKAMTLGKVEIAFSKQNMDALRGEWREKGQTDWLLAGIWTKSKAVHDEPHSEPQAREYRFIFMDENEAVGGYSPIYTVVTTP